MHDILKGMDMDGLFKRLAQQILSGFRVIDAPVNRYACTLHIEDAGRALAAALSLPSGIYNVVSDGERVSNARFKAATGWAPLN